MRKNKRGTAPTPKKGPVSTGPLLQPASLKLIGGGIGLLILGYTVLSFADARAQNVPGYISPFLILGGYAMIGFGLYKNTPDKPL